MSVDRLKLAARLVKQEFARRGIYHETDEICDALLIAGGGRISSAIVVGATAEFCPGERCRLLALLSQMKGWVA